MSTATLNNRAHTTLEQLGKECPVEKVMDLFPDMTWNQIFSAIDTLSRTKQVRVRIDTDGVYWVQSDPHGRASIQLLRQLPIIHASLS